MFSFLHLWAGLQELLELFQGVSRSKWRCLLSRRRCLRLVRQRGSFQLLSVFFDVRHIAVVLAFGLVVELEEIVGSVQLLVQNFFCLLYLVLQGFHRGVQLVLGILPKISLALRGFFSSR